MCSIFITHVHNCVKGHKHGKSTCNVLFFFCFQLEKVLQQGDIGECADPYIKEEKVKKTMKTLQMICNIYTSQKF